MEMNTNLFVKDITLPGDIEMLTADDIAVVSVQEPKEEKEVVAEAESGEADEASDAEEQPAEGEAQEDSPEEAKDDAGDEG